jgi:hypothetical protein
VTTYELGQTITVAVKITDDTGAPANVGGTVTCTAVRPDGTTASATITNPVTGTYQAALTSTIAGRYRLPIVGTGANSGGLPRTFIADVWPADPRFICSLEDLKAELNLPASVTVNDDELWLYIAAATPVVEDIAGRVLQATITETFDGGRTAVLLSDRAASITTVTVDGVATTDYVADLASGIVYAGSSSAPSSFSYGRQNVVVTYVAGGTSVDPNIVLAARIIAAHQYQVGQQGRSGRGRAIDETTIIGSGFAVPTRAMQLLEPSIARRMPGFA